MPSDIADRNDAMVRAFLAAWERRDTEHIMSCLAEDGVYHAVSLQPIVGRDAFRKFVTRFEQVPGGRLEIRHQVASDSVVINERTDHITFRGGPRAAHRQDLRADRTELQHPGADR